MPSNRELPDRQAEEQPLILAFPDANARVLEQFALLHLHPYDVKAGVIAADGGFELTLYYGEGWTRRKQRFFELEALETPSDALTAFSLETAEACKQALIADYYKMMKL